MDSRDEIASLIAVLGQQPRAKSEQTIGQEQLRWQRRLNTSNTETHAHVTLILAWLTNAFRIARRTDTEWQAFLADEERKCSTNRAVIQSTISSQKAIQIEPDVIDFGEILRHEEPCLPFRISATEPLTNAIATTNCDWLSLKPGEINGGIQVIRVNAIPQMLGSGRHTALLHVTAGGFPSREVQVAITLLEPRIICNPSFLVFDIQRRNDASVTKVVQVTTEHTRHEVLRVMPQVKWCVATPDELPSTGGQLSLEIDPTSIKEAGVIQGTIRIANDYTETSLTVIAHIAPTSSPPTTSLTDPADVETRYIYRPGGKLHRLPCDFGNQIARYNRVPVSLADAARKGIIPCRNCIDNVTQDRYARLSALARGG
jgi:hypothetical protein